MCKEPREGSEQKEKCQMDWSCHALVGDVAGQGWP